VHSIAMEGAVITKVVQGLSRSAMFASLKPETITQIAMRGELFTYDSGETVVEEGADSDSFYFVMGGELRVFVKGGNHEPVEVGTLRTPECFGEMGILLDKPRTATIVARGSATLMRFSAPSFGSFMQKIPDFGQAVARFLAMRLSQTQHQLPISAPEGEDVPAHDVLNLLPREMRERHRVVPLKTEGHTVHLGFVVDPTPQTVGLLRQQLRGMDVEIVRVRAEFFEKCMRAAAAPPEWSEGLPKVEENEPKRSSPKLDVLLKRMVAEGASDLHLSGKQEPRWRIDGEMMAIDGARPLGAAEVFELIEPTMRESSKKEFIESNDVDFAYAIEGVSRFRVNLFRDRGGVSAVLRQIPDRILTVEQLGLPTVVQGICEFPKGLIVVTGPTGSGKSTTLAAMVDFINRHKRAHIITLEDPIEFVHRSQACLINQREIGPHTRSFARALKAALREDPDIVLVGEMRDLETVSLALETANTGHLVFGTLHTSTAVSTIDRIIDLFPPEQHGQVRTQLADSLRAVVAQTLCRKLGGGRVAALEILVSNPAVANLIREAKNAQIMSVMTTQKSLGNRIMTEELASLVMHKVIAYEEALSKAIDKNTLAKLCNQPAPRI
jgi:twitching motility protein PilT